MKRLFLFINTLRWLRAKQLYYQFVRRIMGPRIAWYKQIDLREGWSCWSSPNFITGSTLDAETFTFLRQSLVLDKNWNSPLATKLWLYNLHYQNDLNAIGAKYRFDLCSRLVDGWISGNPAIHGNGWEPYCISLRVVNWIKWFSSLDQKMRKQAWIDSLVIQVDILEQQLEYHILGNHLFANAKALVFAGCFFDGDRGDYWLNKGLNLLDKEIAEQFLPDGGHFELSPMYHAALLWDLADLVNLAHVTGLDLMTKRVDEWRVRFSAGLTWLKLMTHPDQEISFFNDSALGIAPTLQNLEDYAKFLGISSVNKSKSSQIASVLLDTSGYGIIDWPQNHRLIMDVAKLGPDYQPGHAHADTLSCELSLFGHRVFVNSGTSTYEMTTERYRQRSTAAHNTMEIDSQNSSEVWAGFRVARRAKPLKVCMKNLDGNVVLTGKHDGYRRLSRNLFHTRTWIASDYMLQVVDEVEGKFKLANVSWHLHPDIQITIIEKSEIKLKLLSGEIIILKFSGVTFEVLPSTWHPEFGKSIANQKICLTLNQKKAVTTICWKKL
jgi:uncharacterized heparinase superfamily protein